MASEQTVEAIKEGKTMDIERIKELIPHRYPMLLVDKIVDAVPGEKATGIKAVTVNEPFFQGHFPDKPVMPGVLIVEAMAQTAGALVVDTLGKEFEGKLVYFMTIDDARFRAPVSPGELLHIHVEVVKSRGLVWKFKGRAMVEDKLCAEATYSAMIIDDESKK